MVSIIVCIKKTVKQYEFRIIAELRGIRPVAGDKNANCILIDFRIENIRIRKVSRIFFIIIAI
jgi:hypothetical protein